MSARGFALDDAAWDSPWRRRCVRDKASLCAGLLLCALVLPWWPGGVATAAVALIVLLGPAKVPAGLLARIIAAPLTFIVIGAATLLITVSWSGGPVLGWAPSLTPAIVVAVRGVAATSSLFVLATTTPMVDLLASLHRARVPQTLIDVTAVAYRMVFVLLESVLAIREAQTARLGYDTRAASLRSASMLMTMVLVRAWDRAGRLEAGLAGRGGNEGLRTLDPPTVASGRFLGGVVLVVATLMVGTWLVVGGSG